MEIIELPIKQRSFLQDLLSEKINYTSYFHYNVNDLQLYEKRQKDLLEREFPREELVDYLLQYNKRFQSDNMNENIKKLLDPCSVVVIGGQQAGLLTGPLYTIHKILSIIVLAKEQEEKLGIPVIPVFWIAGEDHDFDEINHVYTYDKELKRIKKKKIQQPQVKKSAVSSIALDHEVCEKWVEQIFASYRETDYTNELIETVKECMKRSDSYVQFFEELIVHFFSEDGLVLINSGDPELRKLEKPFFREMIKNNQIISKALSEQQELMDDSGYSPIIQTQSNSANLFYEHDGERLLLEHHDQTFEQSQIHFSASETELLSILDEHPERFSNNVVTRPLMQESLFPTLAFIAGPGEIHYWSELKKAFESFSMKMPPIVPRLNITILERSIERDLLMYELELADVLVNGTTDFRKQWKEQQAPVNIHPLIEDAKEKIENIHSQIREAALQIDSSIEPYLKKNAFFIERQLHTLDQFLQKRIDEALQNDLERINRIQLSLKPNDILQERHWNIFYYLNKYGPEFIIKLKNLSYSFNNQHKVVKL